MIIETILKLQAVRKSYTKAQRSVEALGGVDRTITKGEFLSIVGPSGIGKTTLLNIVGCLEEFAQEGPQEPFDEIANSS